MSQILSHLCPFKKQDVFPARFKDGKVAFLSVYLLNREPIAHKITGNLSLYPFLDKYRLSFNSCGCMFAYQQERESRKTLKPLYRTRSPCKQHRVNNVRLECRVQIYSRTVRLIKAILPHVQANKSAVLIMIISSNILSDSCTKKTEKLNRMMPLVNEVVSQAAQLITTGGRFLFRATQ